MSHNKTRKRIILERALRFMAVAVINRYVPKVIGVTGSVGKTSTKDAVFSVLEAHYRVRKSERNYNNEIGLPLSIIGVESGEQSVVRWAGVFLKWLGLMLFPVEYPEILVLEMSADRPGDIEYLVDIAGPRVGIITDISESHIAYFKNLDDILKEKKNIFKNMDGRGFAILNIDNPRLKKLATQMKTRVMTFGFSADADISASDIFYNYDQTPGGQVVKGLSFKLTHKGATMPMRLGNVLAGHSIYAALAAVAVGLEFGLNLVEIGEALQNFSLPAGRMNLLPGIKNTRLIDDTYNASPVSMMAALLVLREVNASRKIAFMGDMLELGESTAAAHREVLAEAQKIDNCLVFLVGKRMAAAAQSLKNNGGSDRMIFFDDPASGAQHLQKVMREGDLVLIKGSQGMRMEKVVEEVMAEPQKAPELLCRQSLEWRAREWKEE